MPSISIPADASALSDAPRAKVRFGEMFRAADGRNLVFTFILVSTLFALWGFCNGQLEVLNKKFQDALGLTKAQSTLVQFVNFMGYFVMAIPSGALARKFGYKGGIIIGLSLVALGAFWFYPATHIATYAAFLIGLFVIASGLAILETVANPYTTVLGPEQAAAARINLAQTCNGLGVMLGPFVGGKLLLSSTEKADTSLANLYHPYFLIGGVVTVIALLFVFAKVPDIAEPRVPTKAASFWQRPHFSMAVLAQFFYVGAQVAIWAFFINYIVAVTPAMSAGLAGIFPAGWTYEKAGLHHVTDLGASRFFSLGGFGMFLLGRFTGSLALRASKPSRMLGLYALINMALMGVVMAGAGWLSVVALLLSFFFMSIMFPTIFSLGISGLGEDTKRASAYIVMAIVGGALMPFPTGFIADRSSLPIGFIVPLVCFGVVLWYASSWERLERRSRTA
jgi:FHS family L-fucose permease-like MFS transporter